LATRLAGSGSTARVVWARRRLVVWAPTAEHRLTGPTALI
jgi:hypothetical protein